MGSKSEEKNQDRKRKTVRSMVASVVIRCTRYLVFQGLGNPWLPPTTGPPFIHRIFITRNMPIGWMS